MFKYILIIAGIMFVAYLLSLLACNIAASDVPFRIFKAHYHEIAILSAIIGGFIYLKYGDR